jgi:hypothetical protein
MIERDITATREAFIAGLRLAFPGDVMTETEQGVRVSQRGVLMELTIAAGPDRAIALLRLPTIRVRVSFLAGSPRRQRAMLEQMDRAMQRGGG